MKRFPACDGVMLRRDETQCVFTEESAARLDDKQANASATRCVRHGNIICDYIHATSLEAARKIAKERANQ